MTENLVKTGFIAIAGRPNVGKSTLLNAMLKRKVSIVSPKPQTTRNRITGILNAEGKQIVFLDTPGFHKPKTELGKYMVKVVRDALEDIDAVLLVVEPRMPGELEADLVASLKAAKTPAVLVINKIDLIKKDELLPVIGEYSKLYDFDGIIPVSAVKGDGISELLKKIDEYLAEGPRFFPEDTDTDQPERQLVAEILREKMLMLLDKEVPHGVAVETTIFEERENATVYISLTIYCERTSHKGIIIGKKGEMLKKISTRARVDMERLLGCKVFLETWIKVKENWRQNEMAVKNFGYTTQ